METSQEILKCVKKVNEIRFNNAQAAYQMQRGANEIKEAIRQLNANDAEINKQLAKFKV